MNKLFFILAILFSLNSSILATAQAPDKILYDNKEFNLFTNPLEDFYNNKNERPKFFIEPNIVSSGNWRGYMAYWEISEESLYLKSIDS